MRTVRHNTGKQFLRLANVDAALLVASRRWVYCKAWEASLAAKPHRRWGRVVLVVLVTALLIACNMPKSAARECFEQKTAQKIHRTSALSYRLVDGRRCYFPRSHGMVAKSEFRIAGAKRAQGLPTLRTDANQRGGDKGVGASPATSAPITFEERWKLR